MFGSIVQTRLTVSCQFDRIFGAQTAWRIAMQRSRSRKLMQIYSFSQRASSLLWQRRERLHFNHHWSYMLGGRTALLTIGSPLKFGCSLRRQHDKRRASSTNCSAVLAPSTATKSSGFGLQIKPGPSIVPFFWKLSYFEARSKHDSGTSWNRAFTATAERTQLRPVRAMILAKEAHSDLTRDTNEGEGTPAFASYAREPFLRLLYYYRSCIFLALLLTLRS